MTVTCEYCKRVVPIAPGRFNVSVPHVAEPPGFVQPVICNGNEKRLWLAGLTHPADALARQHHVMQEDALWEF